MITNENTVTICQFRENEELIGDCFLCIDKSRYISWMFVDRWKPLGLPADVEERVLEEIEKWIVANEHGAQFNVTENKEYRLLAYSCNCLKIIDDTGKEDWYSVDYFHSKYRR